LNTKPSYVKIREFNVEAHLQIHETIDECFGSDKYEIAKFVEKVTVGF
jgi:hypothetical protein